ncbi:MAG: DNA gyrase subunit A [Candidatus Lokiarchaeota archaeon]
MATEKIKETLLKEEMESSYIDYAMSVVVGRAIPDVRDGLKPVHRRIIWSMADNNQFYNRPHVKSARIVGECFMEGTLVNTVNGLKPIESVNIGDKVFTHNGIDEVIRLYEMPEKELLRIELENGINNICTKRQMFKKFNPDLSLSWKTAEELKAGDYIICRSQTRTQEIPIKIGDLSFDNELAYFLGFFLADGWIDRDNKRGYHRISFASESIEILEYIQKILLKKFNQSEKILEKQKNFYYLRINNHELNTKLIDLFQIQNKYSNNISIPHFLYSSPEHVIYSFISGFIDGDGSIHQNRNQLSVHSICKSFIDELQILLFSSGINSVSYYSSFKSSYIEGRLIKSDKDHYSLEITGQDFINILDKLNLKHPKKNKRKFLTNRRTIASKYEEIPYIGKYIFKEFSDKHLGGGWYKDVNGEKIRKDNIKIYKSTIDILNIKEKMESIGSEYLNLINEILEHNYSFIKIKNIQKTEPKKTYDIQVKNNHQFIANGMLAHNCLGKYHPHGDAAVYNSLVRMAQDFSMRYPLIDPQGNFGSVDGDPPAAMRYTEARLSQIAGELIEDIERETVDFQPNFDDSLQEPIYLPAKLPNTIINGTKGIAVGMSTSMAPHNLIEVCQGIVSTIDNPEISIEELMEIIKGPDFPTGGIITNTNGIYNAYSTGRGRIPIKGKIELETHGSKKRLVITEIPYLLNKTSLIEKIADLIKNGILKDISDMRDESDRNGMRIVIDLTKNAQPEIIKNILFKRTRLFSSFNILNLVLINEGRQPKVLNLKELIQEYINHRLNIIYRRNEYELKKAQDRLHKVEGLIIALRNIDDVVNIIKAANDREDAEKKLMQKYELTEIQVKAILSMPLGRLTNLEQKKLFEEQNELETQIEKFKEILASKQLRLNIIKDELMEISKNYGDERRTQIVEQSIRNIKRKDLVKKEPTIVMITKNHYIKRISIKQWRTQNRGGRGKKGMELGEEDFINDLFVCSTHDTILFFTSKGRIYSLKCFEIPSQSRTAKGKPIVNLLPLQDQEVISDMIPINNFKTDDDLIMVTKKGIVKKIKLKNFSRVQSTGIRAQRIKKDDVLVSVRKLTNELQDIFIATKSGYAIRFDESELRDLGRNAIGVKGVELREGDEVVDTLLVTDDDIVLTITKDGSGQRTYIKEYRKTGRGVKGVKNITLDDENEDEVIAVKIAKEKDLIIGTEQGQVIRVPVESIRITHRRAKGVRVINLYEDDSVSAIGKCSKNI